MTVPAVWIANRARFVPLFDYANTAPRGFKPTPLPRRWKAKRATDLLDYGLDCRDYLAGAGDTIASFSLAIDPADMQVPLLVNLGGVLIAWLGGGSAGIDHTATWTLTFGSGQGLVAAIAILVSAAPALPAPALPTLAIRPSETTPLLARDGTPMLPAGGALSSVATTTIDGAAIEIQGGGVLLFRP